MTPNDKFFNILVAEDNDVSRELMSAILKAKGYNVFGAIDGGSAIEVIQNTKIDMAFVDINMEPKGGFDFIKHLIVKGNKLPIVIVTSDTSGDTLVEANALGVKQLLHKPVDPERLVQITERVLTRAGHNVNPLGQPVEHKTTFSPDELMTKAAEIAQRNVDIRKGGPFGAVISDSEGKILGEGANGISSRADPTAHAEVMAIRQATEKLGKADLAGCILYCTSEPTGMGKALITSVGIEKVYYGLSHADLNTLRESTHTRTETSYEQLGQDAAMQVYKSWDALDDKAKLKD
ncbi:response regulator [Alphaproteobacteria bacterium]|nr:response regulator [Alphaproteobacteria bacterium]